MPPRHTWENERSPASRIIRREQMINNLNTAFPSYIGTVQPRVATIYQLEGPAPRRSVIASVAGPVIITEHKSLYDIYVL